jgi:hypothetical protein
MRAAYARAAFLAVADLDARLAIGRDTRSRRRRLALAADAPGLNAFAPVLELVVAQRRADPRSRWPVACSYCSTGDRSICGAAGMPA